MDVDGLAPERDARRTRREPVTEAVDATDDEYALFGHAHFPEVADTRANAGSWTDRRVERVDVDTHFGIEDGEVGLVERP